MSNFAAKIAIASALILAPMSLPALSQTAVPVAPAAPGVDVDRDDDEGRGGYWGLLGLLGLFGLMGRKSSRDEYSTTGTGTAYRDPAETPGTTPRDRY